jgi:CRP-like cAMP-binding protein
MPSPEEVEENAGLLARCSLFSSLDEASRRELAPIGRRRRFGAGTPVFHAGDPGESLLLIVRGSLRVSQISKGGGEIILSDLGPGEALGEIAVLDGRGRTADVAALTDCELLVLERRDLLAFINRHPDFSIALLQLLCARLRRAEQRSSDFLFMGLPGRLAKALLERSAPLPPGGAIALTQGELARIAGATRPNVNRQLKEWERDGLIKITRTGIAISDPPKLWALAHSAD